MLRKLAPPSKSLHLRHVSNQVSWSNSLPKPAQLETLEQDLTDSVKILKDKNHIFSTLSSINELLDPLEERENLDTEAELLENDAAIIAEVCRQEVV